MKSIKGAAHNTKVNAGIEMKVAKGKTSGFHHPEPFAEHLETYKPIKDEIPKLKDRISTLGARTKDLAEAEDKAGQEFVTQSANASQHQKLGQVLRYYGDLQVAIAALRFQYLAVLEGAKDEWKGLENIEMKAIGTKLDNCNRSLCTWQYFNENKEPQKAKDEDVRYQSMATEIVGLIHELRSKKETLEPQLTLRCVQGEVVFFRQALHLAETCENSIRTLGPVQPNPIPAFSMPPSVGGTSIASQVTQPVQHAPAQQQYQSTPAPPPPAYNTAPPVPQYPRARALYPFAPQNPN